MHDTLYNLFRSKQVKADSLEAFLNRYYKRDRLGKRGKEYVEAVTRSHQKDLNNYGYTIISRHESATGEVVAFYKKTPT